MSTALDAARKALHAALLAGADTHALRDTVRRLAAEMSDGAVADARSTQDAAAAVAAQIKADAHAIVQADDERRRRWLSRFDEDNL
ncbi:hypothetical protein [Paraburkholderia sp. A1RO-5L]|uniref:hypothetical protein n=1 Tax=unclassified Paraburkholderia TaxID=2615204 RepID=UPI003B7A3166